MVPSFGGGDDGVGIGFPDERLGVTVVGLDELVDGRLQRHEGREHPAFEPALGELGEHGLDGVEPGARGRGEMEDPARVLGQPTPHLGVLVGGIARYTPLHAAMTSYEGFKERTMAAVERVSGESRFR